MIRRTDIELGRAALRNFSFGNELSDKDFKTAVRYALEEFAARHPGGAVEIRIPWIGAVQAIQGLHHRRGTPPNVVEMDGRTWLNLVLTGKASDASKISYSGTRADLSPYLPLSQVC
ncbi:sterol carrier family protein [Arcanobacterium hippocoleae]